MRDAARSPPCEGVAVSGGGVVGASRGRVAKRDHLVRHIAVCARTQETLDKGLGLGFADSVSLNPAEAVRDADLVVLCTPLGLYGEIAKTMAPGLKPGAIVSDVGSCKETMFRDVGPHLPDGVHMVPAHPVAGTEHSGPEAGFAEWFEGRWFAPTPADRSDPVSRHRVSLSLDP